MNYNYTEKWKSGDIPFFGYLAAKYSCNQHFNFSAAARRIFARYIRKKQVLMPNEVNYFLDRLCEKHLIPFGIECRSELFGKRDCLCVLIDEHEYTFYYVENLVTHKFLNKKGKHSKEDILLAASMLEIKTRRTSWGLSSKKF